VLLLPPLFENNVFRTTRQNAISWACGKLMGVRGSGFTICVWENEPGF